MKSKIHEFKIQTSKMSKKIFLLFIGLVILQKITVAQTPCHAYFMAFNQGTTVSFVDSSYTASGAYNYAGSYYTFGNGTSVHFSYAGWQTVTYNAPGTYVVCLHIKDSVSNCTDSMCQTITVTSSSSGCNTSFSYSNIDSLYSFTPTSWNGIAPYTYHWRIYDYTTGNTLYSGNTNNPSVIIPSGNVVVAALTSTDSVGCIMIPVR